MTEIEISLARARIEAAVAAGIAFGLRWRDNESKLHTSDELIGTIQTIAQEYLPFEAQYKVNANET